MIGGLLLVENARAAISVGGAIGTSTWTTGNSYSLTTDTLVGYGSTLTIQPGVTINFNAHVLTIAGTLKAQGSSNSQIVITNNGYSTLGIDFTPTSTASIIDNATIYSVPITIEGGYTQISNSYFAPESTTPITINGGSCGVVNNVINFLSCNGITVNSGSAYIMNNLVKGQGQDYGIFTQGAATITSNTITNCFSGVYAVTQTTIEQNIIMNNANDGIRSNSSASSIQNNAIANNTCGIGGDGNIQANTIVNNNYGIWGPTQLSTIIQNIIMDNTQNIHLTENATDVNAVNNWWGTIDSAAINQTIWDFKNSSNLGTLDFVPFLVQSNPTAPSVPGSIVVPTPPPTSPTPTPYNATVTPTPYFIQTPTPIPYYTPQPTPTQTPIAPQGTPLPIVGQFSITDIDNMLVIVLSVALAVTIIALINIKFRRNEKHKSADKQRRRKPKNVVPES
jgi:Periplasmic copper-binding protein (NosD)